MTDRPSGSREPAGGFTLRAFSIRSGSMEPTLGTGDRVLLRKVVYGPDRGDVIVFSDPKGRPGPDRGIAGGSVHWLSGGIGIEPLRPPSRVGWIH